MCAAPSRSLTVLQLLPALDGGGVERGTLELGAELVRRGHRSLVISGGGRLVATLETGGSRHERWPIGVKSPLTLRLVPRLRRFLVRERVDVMHVRSRVPGWVGYLAWRGMDRATRPAFVTTVHGLYAANRYSAVMVRGERIIAVSDTVAGYIEKHYPGMDASRVRVIHRGIDSREFPYGHRPGPRWLAAWHGAYPELVGRYVLLLPGRCSRRKGHDDLLRIIERLQYRGKRVHAVVVGGGRTRYLRELRRIAAARNLAITFVGPRSDIRDVYAASDLVLSLSAHPESFGRTTLEALSLGVPVIGYEHGGVGEILRELFPAGCVPAGDVDAVVERICAFMQNPPRVAQHHAYPLTQMLERTLDVYAELAR